MYIHINIDLKVKDKPPLRDNTILARLGVICLQFIKYRVIHIYQNIYIKLCKADLYIT
jgi:hypothetical protein